MGDSDDERNFLDDDSDKEELDESIDSFPDETGNAKIRYQEDRWQLKKLPYATELFDQAANSFTKIKTGLARAVFQQDIEIGFMQWLRELKGYIDLYGFRFTKEDHLWLIRLLLPQVKPKPLYNDTLPVIQALVVLIKPNLLTREDLIIDWRPLFDLFIDVKYKNKWLRSHPKALTTALIALIVRARPFFSEQAPQGILDKTRPFMFSSSSKDAWYLNALFMPANFPEDVQKTHGAGIWLEEAWHWYTKILENEGEYIQSNILYMFMRLAEEAPGYVTWSEERMRVIFTRLIRYLALPNSGIPAPKKWPTAYPTLFVYLIGSSSHECIMDHLKVLCTMLQSTCHPSNSEKRPARIQKIFGKILNKLVARVRRERCANTTTLCQIPAAMKLHQSHLDDIVRLFMPCIELLMFSKSDTVGATSLIRSACALSPGIVLPMLLNVTYPALESVTEPHRLHQSLNAFTVCVSCLVNDETHRIHAIRLTKSLLPGIDINDIGKMVLTFYLAGNLLRSMKIADCSPAVKERNDLTKEELELCKATAEFTTIICDYVDRLLDLLMKNGEACMVPTTGNANAEEQIFEKGMSLIFQSICDNSSTPLYQMVFDRFYHFVATSLFDNEAVCKIVGHLIGVFVRTNLEYTFPRFLKLIIKMLKENISEEDYSDEKPSFSVYWWLHLTTSVLSADIGPVVLQYWEEIQHILKIVAPFGKTNKEAQEAIWVVNSLLRSMCGLYAVEKSKESREEMDKPLTEYLPIRNWSKPIDRDTWEPLWYGTTPEVLAKVEEVFAAYFCPSLEALNAPEKLDKKEMLVHLWRVKSMFRGAASVIPLFKGPMIMTKESRTFRQTEEQPICEPNGFPELTLSGKCLRSVVLDCLSNLLDYVLKFREDDARNIGEIAHLLGSMDDYKGTSKAQARAFRKVLALDRRSVNRLQPRQGCIARLVDRSLQLIHGERLTKSAGFMISENSMRVLRLLLCLSTSHYPLNRMMAQKFVRSIATNHLHCFAMVKDEVLGILDPEKGCSHEQVKGTLHLLHSLKSGTGGTYATKLHYWKAVILTRDNQKESIITLVRNICSNIRSSYVVLQLEYEVDSRSIEVAREVLSEEERECPVEVLREEKETRKRDFLTLVETLLEVSKMRDIHWNQERSAVDFLFLLIRRDVEMPPAYLSRFLERLTDDQSTARLMSIDLLSHWLRIHRPKSKKVELLMDTPTNCRTGAQWPIPYGLRQDNTWLMYDEETLPKSDEEWNRMRFYKKSAAGFYTWKERIMIHAPLGEQNDRRVEELSEQEREILEMFSAPAFLERFKPLFAVEGGFSSNDAWDSGIGGFFKQLAKTFNHHICGPLQQLLISIFPSNRKADHRLATEIVSGLLNGSRLWRWEHQRAMWQWLAPLLTTVLDNITDECLSYWKEIVTRVGQSVDPRSLHHLIEFLFERAEKSVSSANGFALKTNIELMWRLVLAMKWRGGKLAKRMLHIVTPLMGHSIEDVRREVATCLLAAAKFYAPGMIKEPSISEAFMPITEEQIDALYQEMLKPCWSEVRRKTSSGRVDPQVLKGARLAFLEMVNLKGMLLANCMMSVTPSMIRGLPLFCYYANDVGDVDLVKPCGNFARNVLRRPYYNPKDTGLLLEVSKQILESPTSWWKAKLVLIRLVHVVIANNLFEFQKHHDVIRDMMCASLQDARLEVRVGVRDALKDLFLTGFLSPEPLISTFLHSSTSINEIERHGAVLGLSACVVAAPYSVPTYLPPLLMALDRLSRKNKLLETTVKWTVAEFKRTHQDSWHEHHEHFSEEQLEVLTGLMTSPNYYM